MPRQKVNLFSFLVLANVIEALLQVPACPGWGPMDSFLVKGIEGGRYLGRWWLQDRTLHLGASPATCSSQTYTVNEEDLSLWRRSTYWTSQRGSKSEVGEVIIEDPLDANLLTYSPSQGRGEEVNNYRVLATDYETFSIEYQCLESAGSRRDERIWIFTREEFPSRSVLRRAYSSLRLLGLTGWKLQKTRQGCVERKGASGSLSKRKTGAGRRRGVGRLGSRKRLAERSGTWRRKEREGVRMA